MSLSKRSGNISWIFLKSLSTWVKGQPMKKSKYPSPPSFLHDELIGLLGWLRRSLIRLFLILSDFKAFYAKRHLFLIFIRVFWTWLFKIYSKINLLALVWLELARLVIFLGLLACFTLVWFGWFGCLSWFYLLCCTWLAWFALLCNDMRCLTW